MKKLITVMLLLTMLCALFVGSAYADAADVEVTVTSSATDVNIGDTITVTVAIDHETAITGFGLPYDYDKEILKVVGAPAFNSDFLTAGGMAMPSPTTALWLGMGASTTYTGDLLTITFEVIGGIGKTTDISIKASGTDGFKGTSGTLTANVTPVTITVTCAHANGTELKDAKDASCSAEGYTGDQVCKDCGVVVTEGTVIEKTPHGETELKDAKDATCSAEGYTGDAVCKVCGETVTTGTVIEKKPHTAGEAVKENEVAATCTEAGSYDEVVYCTVCEEEISREKKTVDALGHDVVVDEAVAPTCTATGLTEGSHCERCKEVLVAQEVKSALGHDEKIDVAVAPTCTATGLTEGKHCDRCKEVLVAQTVVDALGHIGGEATCVDLAVCDRCGEGYGELNADNHAGTSEIQGYVPATCTEGGWSGTGVCTECKQSLGENTPTDALGHAMDEGTVTTEPTCETDGVKTFQCTREGCDHEETEVVEKTGHNYDTGIETIPATCEVDGVKTFTCQNDATHTYTEPIAAIGHDWDEGTVTTEPTCEAEGEKTFVCQNDPSHTKAEPVAALGHDWELTETITAPTCEENGEGVYTCKNDATHTKNDVIEKLGHTWDEGTVTKEATTTEEGEMTYKCTVEGCEGTTTEPIEKLKPSGSGSSDKDNSNIPDTGDDSPIALLVVVMILCASSVLVLTTKKRKN